MRYRGAWIAVTALLTVAAKAVSAPDAALDWAFPSGPKPAHAGDPLRRLTLENTTASFTRTQIDDLFNAVDWMPGEHPPMPSVVAHGHPPEVRACGYCHMPGGEGRPENAALAGLPRAYIVNQVRRFATDERTGAASGWLPTAMMTGVAKHASLADIDAAATYYSQRTFVSRLRVIEAAVVPRPVVARFLLVRGSGTPDEPLGQRIVEEPVSMQRFELRAPAMDYVAYVPPGSIARGAALAGGAGAQACGTCHGTGLQGDIGPPLAGRSPSYLFRQLEAFHLGTRSGQDAAPMRAVTAQLGTADMIALAAYAASRKPG